MNITPNPEKVTTQQPPAEKRKRGRPRKNPIPLEKLNNPKIERVKETIKGGNIKGVKGNKRKSEFIYPPSTGCNNIAPTPAPAPTQSIYNSPEIIESVIEKLSNGYTPEQIAEADNTPHARTIRRWIADNTHNARQAYTHAREIRAAAIIAEIRKVIENCPDDSSAAVNKARLHVDFERWLLSKHYPEIYGDTAHVEVSTNGTLPLVGIAAIAEVQKIRQMLNITPTAEPPKLDNAAPAEVIDLVQSKEKPTVSTT